MNIRKPSESQIATIIRDDSLQNAPIAEKDRIITETIKKYQEHRPEDLAELGEQIRELQHDFARNDDFCADAGLNRGYIAENLMTIRAGLSIYHLRNLEKKLPS